MTDAEAEPALAARTDGYGRVTDASTPSWDATSGGRPPLSPGAALLPAQRRRLIGAYFTQEFAVEGAALFNPSIVAHPEQSGPPGSARFLMTLRAVGEGHISSIALRTGVIDGARRAGPRPASGVAAPPTPLPATYRRDAFEPSCATSPESLELGLRPRPAAATFTRGQLEAALADLLDQRLTRGSGVRAVDRLTWLADSNYAVDFPESSAL